MAGKGAADPRPFLLDFLGERAYMPFQWFS